ncbi:PDR/VanB family oxidoreductase [Corynebacterium sp. Marseille-P8863]|uniref:PDR/VanB family oxidoreductase n=1 Tax=Corynebacterium sp. Marseille-P8863 TaxID=2866576 RepID=UPI0022655089|nr:PDR/VanB family oxidoreductase [Corynebacterium sp. Marseille-P8863]
MGNDTGIGRFTAFFGGKKKKADPNAADREAALESRRATKTERRGSGDIIELTVTGVERAHGIALITFETQDGAPLPGYEPGCHADFLLRTPDGEELVRQFSLFPTHYLGDKEGAYGIEVKREAGSKGGSAAIHRIEVGDPLRIRPPRNNFPLAKDAKRSVLVGAGVGIAPIFSLARELQIQHADYSVLYFASSEERALMRHLIDTYLHGQTKSIFASVERDKQAGYIEEALAASAVPAEDTHLYVCGPHGFMDGVIETALASLPQDNIHFETYRPTKETLAGNHDADGAFDVIFNGETYHIPEGESVLDVFEDEDVPILSQCAEGTCGTCVMRVIDGIPDHRDSVFTEERHEKGAFTTCVSRSLSPTLTLERWRQTP